MLGVAMPLGQPTLAPVQHIYWCYYVPGPVQSIWVYKDNKKLAYHKKLLKEIALNLDCSDLFLPLQLQPFYRLNPWVERWDKIVY